MPDPAGHAAKISIAAGEYIECDRHGQMVLSREDRDFLAVKVNRGAGLDGPPVLLAPISPGHSPHRLQCPLLIPPAMMQARAAKVRADRDPAAPSHRRWRHGPEEAGFRGPLLTSDFRIRAASRPAPASTSRPVKSRTCHRKNTKAAARVARNVTFRATVVE